MTRLANEGARLTFASASVEIDRFMTDEPPRHESAGLAIDDLERVLRLEGCELAHLVHLTIYLTDIADSGAIDAAIEARVPTRMACTVFAVEQIDVADRGRVGVLINAVAARPE